MQYRRLEQLEKQGRPIRVGLVGCGRMGVGVINQVNCSPGMRIAAVADITLDRAEAAARAHRRAGVNVCATDDLGRGTLAVERGEVVAIGDSEMLARLPLDVIVEATGIPDSGARVALQAIQQKKHVVTMNVETDAVVGPMLNHLAQQNGVVYSVTEGDEPGLAGRMFNLARSVGLEVIAIGKGCMHPIDWNANAQTLAEEGRRVGVNPKMLASFRDGSKHCVEACVIANGTGLVPDVRGTHARALRLDEIPKVICLKEDGGILNRRGVVELAPPVFGPDGKRDLTNSVTPGVYLVVTSENPEIRADFTYLLMGDGPYYLLHRPFHLCAIETPFSIASAFLYGDPTLSPLSGRAPVAEVICVAKRDLQPGETITGSGGAEITGMIDHRAICREENLLPLGLSYDVKVKRPLRKAQPVTLDDVELDEASTVFKLWKQLNEIFPVKKREMALR
jgi:predicted homoserine dehydrogenase-like protein